MKQIRMLAQYYVDLMMKLGLVRFSMLLAFALVVLAIVVQMAVTMVLSSSVKSPIPGLAISNGLRPGLAMAAKTLADEYGPRGGRVPTAPRHPMTGALPENPPPARVVALLELAAALLATRDALATARDALLTAPTRSPALDALAGVVAHTEIDLRLDIAVFGPLQHLVERRQARGRTVRVDGGREHRRHQGNNESEDDALHPHLPGYRYAEKPYGEVPSTENRFRQTASTRRAAAVNCWAAHHGRRPINSSAGRPMYLGDAVGHGPAGHHQFVAPTAVSSGMSFRRTKL